MFQQANVCQCKVSATRGMADCSPCYTPLCVMHIDDDNDDVNYHGSIVLLNNSVKLCTYVVRYYWQPGIGVKAAQFAT